MTYTIENGYKVSPLQVLVSAAGHYIGRTYFEEEFQAEFPYDRDSGYFRSREEAEEALATGIYTRRHDVSYL